ncbi:hypothetical protein EDC30_101355 [Paucimonas lemoignei]|uniref:Uncharacterized protein n=1 Tax=Paucimonas lemoignei TaxID=29443 RepID=A0A4R3I5W3_PAULE|nr:hypothetical protein [Paucimonas lemoignei]TCS39399.1 hypothetical protein EDC30_101355 [Paucimonas lemoignei]
MAAEPQVAAFARQPALPENMLKSGARSLNAYAANGGWTALCLAVSIASHDIVARIVSSRLRGRGWNHPDFHHPDLMINRVTSPFQDRIVKSSEYKVTAVQVTPLHQINGRVPASSAG